MERANERAARAGDVTGRLAFEVMSEMPSERRKVIPPAVIIALIQALALVVQACYPQPVKAARFLTPPTGWFGVARWLWENKVRAAVADAWEGEGGALEDVQAAILARLEAGVGLRDVRCWYEEAGAGK